MLCVSSAKLLNFDSSVHKFKSAIMIVNSNGDSREPCGVPIVMSAKLEVLPNRLTACFLPVRYDSIQLIVLLQNPYIRRYLNARLKGMFLWIRLYYYVYITFKILFGKVQFSIMHSTWFVMDHLYGASVEKSTFYHMSEFQKPTAHYRSKIGIKKWHCILWICLEKKFWAQKNLKKSNFCFLNLSLALLNFGAL